MKGGDRTSLLVVVCLAVGGCYTYRPIDSPTPGAEVRARLTADAAVRRSQGLDTPVLHVDGRVVESTRDSLALDVLVARSSSTFQQVEIRDTVRLAAAEVQSLMGRRLSATKSVLVAVATGVAAIAVVKGIDQVVGGTNDDENGGPPAARIPPLRWFTGRLLLVFRPGKQ